MYYFYLQLFTIINFCVITFSINFIHNLSLIVISKQFFLVSMIILIYYCILIAQCFSSFFLNLILLSILSNWCVFIYSIEWRGKTFIIRSISIWSLHYARSCIVELSEQIISFKCIDRRWWGSFHNTIFLETLSTGFNFLINMLDNIGAKLMFILKLLC